MSTISTGCIDCTQAANGIKFQSTLTRQKGNQSASYLLPIAVSGAGRGVVSGFGSLIGIARLIVAGAGYSQDVFGRIGQLLMRQYFSLPANLF